MESLQMLKVAIAGSTIVPAMPAFYERPGTRENLVDYVVGKVLDILRIEHNLYSRWEGPSSRKENTHLQKESKKGSDRA